MADVAAAMPPPKGVHAHIVDLDLFRLLVQMETRKAQRLRYVVSVMCVDIESESLAPALVSVFARTLRATDAVTARDGSSVALLLVDADASDLPMIVRRLQAAGLDDLAWSAGGACYPETAGSDEELLAQALAMMTRAKRDGGRRFYPQAPAS